VAGRREGVKGKVMVVIGNEVGSGGDNWGGGCRRGGGVEGSGGGEGKGWVGELGREG